MSTNFHSIKAKFYDNVLTEDPNDFVARVVSEKTLHSEDVCHSAVNRGGANTTAATMEHNVNLFFKEMAYLLCDGFSINTGYFIACALIKGVFNSSEESFNSEKHTLLMQFLQGDIMRKMLPDVKVEILGIADSGANISQVVDVKSNTVNELLTPNRNLKIKGSKIRLSGEHADIGVYFVNQSDSTRIKVPSEDIVTNNPSELIIVIPELAVGTYQLEIISQFTNGSILKEPRTTVFDKTLVVQ